MNSRAAAPSVVAKFGGKYIVRGGEFEALEGDWNRVMVVVLVDGI